MTSLKDRIIEHFTANPGKNVNYATLGTTYSEASPVFDELFADGVLEWRKVPSASGKRMVNKIFLTA